jgi:hypothetical protein
MNEIISILEYFGITADQVVPLGILGGVILWAGYKHLKPIKKSISRITNACIEIQSIFEEKGIPLRHHLIEAPGSPLHPTEYGEKLIIESGLKKILDERKDFLIEELKKRVGENKTEYDVQEKARALLVELKESALMNPVKSYAYDNGINVDFILKAGGLWLRDDFLGNPRGVNREKEA